MVDAQLTAESQMTFEYKLGGAVSAVCVRDSHTAHADYKAANAWQWEDGKRNGLVCVCVKSGARSMCWHGPKRDR